MMRSRAGFRKIILRMDEKKKNEVIKKIESYLNREDKILDLGCGHCNVCNGLCKRGMMLRL